MTSSKSASIPVMFITKQPASDLSRPQLEVSYLNPRQIEHKNHTARDHILSSLTPSPQPKGKLTDGRSEHKVPNLSTIL